MFPYSCTIILVGQMKQEPRSITLFKMQLTPKSIPPKPDLCPALAITHSLCHVFSGLCAFTQLALLPGRSFLSFTCLPLSFSSSLNSALSLPANLPLPLPYFPLRSLHWELNFSPTIIIPCCNYMFKNVSTSRL